MIKISKMADYGILLLAYMSGKPPDDTFTARDLSSATGLPLPMVSKVLKVLAKGELLASHRGVKGGYNLSRGPEEINAAEIIKALDGPIAITSCLNDSSADCGVEHTCVTRSYWGTINDRIVRSLESVSLAEMTATRRRFQYADDGQKAVAG